MAYKVVINKRFAIKVIKISEYLEKEWSLRVARTFLAKVDAKILSISDNPQIGTLSIKFPSVRKMLVTKHNKIYYRTKGKTITLIDLVQTRMDPKRNKYD
jgi:plasmid stabilization system protein ParE